MTLLDQDQVWTTREGETLRLEEMGARHRRNTLAFIRRQARSLAMQEATAAWSFACMCGGEMASYYAEQAAAQMDEIAFGSDEALREWIDEFPLVVRLAALVAEDERQAAAEKDWWED